jgi:3-methyl-2-oxobutanoate hydroxymethyltransferase
MIKKKGCLDFIRMKKVYAQIGKEITDAFREYVKDVHSGVFPSDEHCYHIRKGMEDEYREMLKEYA